MRLSTFYPKFCAGALLFSLPLWQVALSQAANEAPLPRPQVGLPQLGLSGSEVLSPATERSLGQLFWGELRADSDFVMDAALNHYLARLTQRLNPNLALKSLRPFVVRDKQLNAFALPGGLIGLHSGLWQAAESESELASVLAHEMGHISQRHFARMMQKSKQFDFINMASIAAAVLAARSGSASSGDVFNAAIFGGEAASVSQRLAFSRDLEREADNTGLQLLQQSGFNAKDMTLMFRRLAGAASLNESAYSVYARSHPGVGERIAAIDSRLRYAPSTANLAPSLNYHLAQVRMLALAVKNNDDKQAALAHINDMRPALAPAQLAAVQAYGRLLLGQTVNAAELQGATHPWLLIATQAVLKEAPAYNPAWQAQPEMVVLWGQLVLNLKAQAHYAQLDALLRDYCRRFDEDDTAWQLLAQLYEAQGKAQLTAWATAQQYAAQGVWSIALQQLEKARRGADYALASQIDAQSKQIREIAAEQQKLRKQF